MLTHSSLETQEWGQRIGSSLAPGTIMLLNGPLGAGKTTFAKGVGRGLGVVDVITSPTYTIVSEYAGRVPFYHIDLYRISGEDEFIALGLDDLLYGDGVSLIEWPERAGSELDAPTHSVTLTILPDGARSIEVTGT